MTELTRKQQKIRDFLEKYQASNGRMPSHREIAGHFGFKSRNAVTNHLRLLKAKGVVTSARNTARSIQLLSPLKKLRSQVFDVPLYGSIPAGLAEMREQDAEGCVSVDINSIGYKPTKNAFALRVNGDSMIGKHIVSGDYVILEHGPEPRNGEIVAALIDGESTLKTFIVKNGKPFLKAENPRYPNLLPAHELVIQGVFRALVRPAKP